MITLPAEWAALSPEERDPVARDELGIVSLGVCLLVILGSSLALWAALWFALWLIKQGLGL